MSVRDTWGEEVLKLTDGLRFQAGPQIYRIDSLRISPGSWLAFVPSGGEPVVDPSSSLARTLATLDAPVRGTVELFGHNVYRLPYGEVQRLRSRIGFVHGYGGLLSNRTVRENIALPVSIHGQMTAVEEERVVEMTLADFALEKVAELQPHQMDGATRWRVCLARSLILTPGWLVLEGLGNWEMDRGRGVGWRCLVGAQKQGRMATAICLPRQNPGFESWFLKQGGKIVRYSKMEGEFTGRTVINRGESS